MAKSSIYIPHLETDDPLKRLGIRLKGEARRWGDDTVRYYVRRRAAGAAAVGALCGLVWYNGGMSRPLTRVNMTVPGRPVFDSNITELADFLKEPDMLRVEDRDLPGLEYPEALDVFVGHLAVKLSKDELSLSPLQTNLLETMQHQIASAR